MFPLTTLANACPPKVQFKMENPIIFTKLKYKTMWPRNIFWA